MGSAPEAGAAGQGPEPERWPQADGEGGYNGGHHRRAGAGATASGGQRGWPQRRASSPSGGRGDGLRQTDRVATAGGKQASRPDGVPIARWVWRGAIGPGSAPAALDRRGIGRGERGGTAYG
jgi:hypothetical protein